MFAALTLAACGGGSDGSSLLTAGQQSALSDFDAAAPTDPGAIPSADTFDYVGTAAFGPNNSLSSLLNNPTLVSDVVLTVDFDTDTMGGTFSSFQSATAAPVTGTLTLSDGSVSDAAVAANIAGDLTIGGELTNISGVMVGQFTGAAAEGLGGAVAANQTNGSGTSDIFGIFGASR